MPFAQSQASKGGATVVDGTIGALATANTIDLRPAPTGDITYTQTVFQDGGQSDSSSRLTVNSTNGANVTRAYITTSANIIFNTIDYMPGGCTVFCFVQDSGFTIQVDTGGNLQLANGAQYLSSTDGDTICFNTTHYDVTSPGAFIILQDNSVNLQ